ncbi:MAG TPA: ribonuclease R [Syntrophomonadaceae bacterium]|nr:ribonuclease R [Syntrophomonadaceae bacterium]
MLGFMRRESYRPLSYGELIQALEVESGEAEIRFSKELGRLEKQGEIVKTRKNKYGLPEMMNLVKGVINISQRGYGILKPDDVNATEIFVFGKNLNGAMHHDRVMVRLQEKVFDGQRPEGEVIRTIKRANKELVGTFERGRSSVQVIPDDSRQIYPINVKAGTKLKVKSGDKVLVAITAYPDKNKYPDGKIIEVLGRKGQPGLDIQVVIRKHGLKDFFPEAVIAEAQAIAEPVSAREKEHRRDLTGVRMVTMDGADAKDLDDAVSIVPTDKGYQLGVHIADVSHYVKEKSKLDKEAFDRGTSVYLIDKVLPMLPPELSNDICSLNAGADRMALSCIMNLDSKGNIIDYDLCKSVIHIDERMTYEDVNKILAGSDQNLIKRYGYLREDFRMMKELADILREKRKERGALDFDFPETKVIVDENSFPVEIKKAERGAAEMIIEDFMIGANEVVAEHIYRAQMPILYRVHQKPDEDALAKLNQVLGVFGMKVDGRAVDPKTYQKILAQIKGRPEEPMIAMMLLRSMKHASYMPEALGHFGLASRYYCHFTSPIRRYPDLIVHRVLSEMLDGTMNEARRSKLEKRMAAAGEHCSMQEIKAEEAERELTDIKKAQYMEQFIGDEFEARIVSVHPFGLFVQLDNTVEGLIHVSSIADDYYEFNDRNHTLQGRHTGHKFAIGGQVRVQLVRVDVDEARIDFELI